MIYYECYKESRKGDETVKVRPFPAVLSLVITLAVLFGGWLLYEWFQVTQPIGELLDNEEHVADYDINVTPRSVTVNLQVEPAFSLNADYLSLLEQIKQTTAQENVTITLKDKPDDKLQTTWNGLYFIFAEGIANREYHTMLEQLEQQPLAQNVQLQVAMDEENVYVLLQETEGEQALFRVLPLGNGQTGVKENA